jgi:hypothetical protein
MCKKMMRFVIRLVVLVSLILILPGGSVAAAFTATRVSVASNGTEGNEMSRRPSISADGRYVAFDSDATNLVSGDTNNAGDIFMHDLQTGQTTRVSLASGGSQANGGSDSAVISGDGHHVAFISSATNLDPTSLDTNSVDDVFVRNLQTGITKRVSVSSSGEQANGVSDYYLAISADGRFIAFRSYASNLVSGDTNNASDIFVHDLQTGSTERVSVSTDEEQANDGSYEVAISADGNVVTFSSRATNLVSGDTNGSWDVFVRDRLMSQTTRATVNSNGEEADKGGSEPSISDDGRYVVFSSVASNLMTEDNYYFPQIFINDRQTGKTTLVSDYGDWGPMVGWSEYPVVSADGRYVAFEFDDKGDGLAGRVIQLHDCVTGATTQVAPGYDETNSSYSPVISSDGRFLAFSSNNKNLVPNDTNNVMDVFERELITPVVKTYQSLGAQDGWIIESGEFSEVGGHVDATASTFYLGDAANNQQYRSILHFDTASLPNNAVITKASLKIIKQGTTGTNPFSSLGDLLLDIRKPFFGSSADLEVSDFQAAADSTAAGSFGSSLIGGGYVANLDATAIPYINTIGTTQFRLRFALDDNNNQSADFLKLFSGDATSADRPYLTLEYYVPMQVHPIVLAILRASPNPSDANVVAYTVAFNESVTGVDATDFAITATGTNDYSISNVSGSGDTWTVQVNTGASLGTLRLDVVDDDSIINTSHRPLGGDNAGNGNFTAGEIYTITLHPTFVDVPFTHWAWQYIESIYTAGITNGCGFAIYCPDDTVTRAQMAVFLERGIRGSGFTPPAATGTVFTDVPANYWAGGWIEQLSRDSITNGCGNKIYCPEAPVTRAEMSVFLLRAKYGSTYVPPLVETGTGFTDVPTGYWAAAWIKQLAAEGITNGCAIGRFCPNNAATRAEMAVFLQRTFNLPLP